LTTRRTGPSVANASRLTSSSSRRASTGGAAAAPAARSAGAGRRGGGSLRVCAASTSMLLSALAEAGQAAADTWRRRGDGAAQRAEEPGVHGLALARGGGLDRRLQRLGQAERDPCAQPLVRLLGRRRLGRLVLDVDEERLLAREAHLDVAGRDLLADLQRRLLQHVEEPEAERGVQRLAEPLCGRG